MRIAASLILLLLPSVWPLAAQVDSPQSAAPSVALPPELARVLSDYERAFAARDAAALAQLFAEDGYVLPSGRPPVKGRAAIARYYTGHGGPLVLRALAYGMDGAAAYIIGGYTPARGAADAGKFTLTLRKDADGRWLILSDMDSSNTRPAGQAAQPAGAQEDAREETVRALQASADEWNKGSLDGFIAPYHEGSMFMTREGPIGRAAMRERYEKGYFSGGKPLQQLRFEQLNVIPLAGDAALMTGRFFLSGGGKADQKGWFTLIWMRTPQGWKIVHDHTS